METQTGGSLTSHLARQVLGINRLLRQTQTLPLLAEEDTRLLCSGPPRTWRPAVHGPRASRAWPHPVADWRAAYVSGATTPRQVCLRALQALPRLAARTPSMNVAVSWDEALTLDAADAATARYAAGAPLGPLDGIPFLIKDQFDVEGQPTTLGSRSAFPLARRDATVVARLRRAGAVPLCKTVLTELGLSPMGTSTRQDLPRNAHVPERLAGGSSTGSAVGVALGLAPLAIAGDGGGSIRIPAALNGVFGLKPTFGRVSGAGDGFQFSVAHRGPVGVSVADLALFLDAVASEPDPEDPHTRQAPPPPPGGFGAWLEADLRGVRIGVDERAWRDTEPSIVRACLEALHALEREGARLVPVHLPLAPHAPAAGYLVLAQEVGATLASPPEALGDDARMALALLSHFSEREFLRARSVRAQLRRELVTVFAHVDALALPTLAATAPLASRLAPTHPSHLAAMCRHCILGNLTGWPAGSAPVGLDAVGVPVGLQLLADAWDEPTVLGLMAWLERLGVARVLQPPGALQLLAGD